MMERSELKSKAKAQLKGRWALAIGTILAATVLMSIFSVIGSKFAEDSTAILIISTIISIIVTSVMSIGVCQFVLNIAADKEAAFADIFSGFNIFLKALGLYILLSIVIFIGTLILIIPGIILSLMFSQCYFIMADDREIGIIECMKKSAQMMKGHKWEYFVLLLSFLGWCILALIPCGIGLLWFIPYEEVTLAEYYLELNKQSSQE